MKFPPLVFMSECLVGFVVDRTQLPQAAGMAYSLKMDKKDACVVAFIGDGGTSEVLRLDLVGYLLFSHNCY